MKKKIVLPRPTKDDLETNNKVEYITRILSSDILRNYNISVEDLTKAAIKNFNLCYTHEKPLSN